MAVRDRALTDVHAGAGLRARAVAIPAWVWLTAIVVVSIVVRIALARRMVAPWIMIDEIVYSELAKSFASHGQFLVRDVPSHGYGFVYPVLIAPAWRLFDAVPDAYRAIDIIVVPRTDDRVSRLVTPLKPFEAMAAGRPLVVSDVPSSAA